MIDGDILIVIGVILSALFVFIGTKLKDKKSKYERSLEISELKDTITNQKIELQAKQDEISRLTQEILDFNQKIDSNTSIIKEVSEEVKGITANTNLTSSIIKDEQRKRGKIEFVISDFDVYKIRFGGMSIGVIGPETPEYFATMNGISPRIKMVGNNILVDITIKDINGNIIFQMIENQWIVNKSFILSVNYNSKGIEVIDYTGMILFRMIVDKGMMNIEGVFFHESGVTLITYRSVDQFGYKDLNGKEFLNKMRFYSSVMTPIFIHYGEDYLGRRIEK